MRDEGEAPHRISHTDARHLWWTPAQMVVHHTAGGCDLRPGDLMGSGVIVADCDALGMNCRHARRASCANSKRCHGRLAIIFITKPATSGGTPGESVGSGTAARRLGDVIGKYTLVGVLGEGGMATVFAAAGMNNHINFAFVHGNGNPSYNFRRQTYLP